MTKFFAKNTKTLLFFLPKIRKITNFFFQKYLTFTKNDKVFCQKYEKMTKSFFCQKYEKWQSFFAKNTKTDKVFYQKYEKWISFLPKTFDFYEKWKKKCQKYEKWLFFLPKIRKMTKLFAKKYEKWLSFLPKILKITKFFAKNTKKWQSFLPKNTKNYYSFCQKYD